jgi:serine/threonine-protein kinase RsbT
MGLGGSRRLVNEFAIESSPGQGTVVTVTRWR